MEQSRSVKNGSRKLRNAAVLKRGSVYCLESFTHRILDWWDFQHSLPVKAAPAKTNRKAKETTPSRIQPSRTAKQRAANEIQTIQRFPKRRKSVVGDYVLVHDSDEGGRNTFHREVLELTLEKILELEGGDGTEDGLNKLERCGIAECPWACTDMKYCLHGLIPPTSSRRSSTRRKSMLAVEADMLPSPTLGNWRGMPLEAEEISRHIVRVAGLVFAVDICSGAVRVAMM
jgi:hypothetical protein